MEAQLPMTDSRWGLGPGPYIFSGVPPLCTGEIDLINYSADKVRVRTIPVLSHDEHAPSLGLGELRVHARLGPQNKTRVPAHFLVDPRTPPGRYTGTVAFHDPGPTLVVHVLESPGVEVDPDTIRLRGAGGDQVSALLVLANTGNVVETIPEFGVLFLEERDWVGRSLVFGLRESGEGEGHQAYLDRVVHELRATLVRPMTVTIRGVGEQVKPGERRELQLEMVLPAELLKGRTYIGSAPFMSSRLSFEIQCNGSSHSTKRRPR